MTEIDKAYDQGFNDGVEETAKWLCDAAIIRPGQRDAILEIVKRARGGHRPQPPDPPVAA